MSEMKLQTKKTTTSVWMVFCVYDLTKGNFNILFIYLLRAAIFKTTVCFYV